MRKETSAWGILLGHTDFALQIGDVAHGLAGIYMQSSSAPDLTPRTALFRTRRQARGLQERVRSAWPRACVVKLRITVEIT